MMCKPYELTDEMVWEQLLRRSSEKQRNIDDNFEGVNTFCYLYTVGDIVGVSSTCHGALSFCPVVGDNRTLVNVTQFQYYQSVKPMDTPRMPQFIGEHVISTIRYGNEYVSPECASNNYHGREVLLSYYFYTVDAFAKDRLCYRFRILDEDFHSKCEAIREEILKAQAFILGYQLYFGLVALPKLPTSIYWHSFDEYREVKEIFEEEYRDLYSKRLNGIVAELDKHDLKYEDLSSHFNNHRF